MKDAATALDRYRNTALITFVLVAASSAGAACAGEIPGTQIGASTTSGIPVIASQFVARAESASCPKPKPGRPWWPF